MRRFLMMLMILTTILAIRPSGLCEEEPEETEMVHELIVTATRLNGRIRPGKRSTIGMIFDYADKLTPTGKWSKNHQWVEVEGGENGTVWVNIEYVSEEMRPRTMRNIHTGRVKIRKAPVNGRLSGYLKKNAVIDIDQMVLGWGHCRKGWINLAYLEEVIEE